MAAAMQPDLRKRGAIRGVFEGRYRLTRDYSPKQRNRPGKMEGRRPYPGGGWVGWVWCLGGLGIGGMSGEWSSFDPEAASMALLGTGIAALGASRRRRA